MGAVAVLGEPVADFELPATDGRIHRLSEARGDVLILTLWSADCPHSTRADAAIADSAPKWGGQVTMWRIACNPNETDEAIRVAAESRGAPFVLLDRDQAVTRLLGGLTTPHFFMLDHQRILCYRGGLDDVGLRQKAPTRHYLEEAVAAALAGRVPDPAETPSFGCAIVWRMEGRTQRKAPR